MPAADDHRSGTGGGSAVTRADRVRDWIALGLVLLGAVVYGGAHRGMSSLARDRTPTTLEQAARGEWKMARWNRFERASRIGMLMVAVGAGVAIWSFAQHAARRREARRAA